MEQHRAGERHDVGVLFVHGIGEQRRAGTLVDFGEALTDCLARWLGADAEGNDKVTVSRATLRVNGEADTTPAHASLELEADGERSRWLLAESWWASSFAAPRYADLLKWAFRVLPWTIATHFYRRFVMAQGWWKLVAALLLVMGVTLLPLVVVFLLVLTLVIGILPIPRLRTAIQRLQKVLLGTVGDSYVLNESSIRGMAMTTQVIDDLDWLKGHCERVVVLAHSQGAAVSHAALRSLVDHGQAERLPDLLVTFGAGLRKLLLLRTVGRREIAASWLLSFALMSISWALWRIVEAIWRGDLANPDLIMQRWGFGAWLQHLPFDLSNVAGLDLTNWRVLLGVLAVIGFVYGVFLAKGFWLRLAAGVGMALLYLVGVALLYPLYAAGPWVAYTLIWTALVIGLCFLLGKFTRDNASGELFLDKHLQWHDYYAAADAVPNGPITRERLEFMRSRKINNRNSLFADHTSYWQNVEQFVLSVARAVAEVCGKRIDVSARDPLHHLRAMHRRRWRVGWLALMRFTVSALVIALAWSLYDGHWSALQDVPTVVRELALEMLGVLRSIPALRLLIPEGEDAWLPPLLYVSAALAALYLARYLIWSLWCWWDAHDRSAFYAREDFTLVPLPQLILFGTLAALPLIPGGWDGLSAFYAETLRPSPEWQAFIDRGWYAMAADYPLSLLGALPTATVAGFMSAAGLGAAVNWWTWRWPDTGADDDFLDILKARVWFSVYFPLTAAMVVLVFHVGLGAGSEQPLNLSPWIVGLLALPVAVLAVAGAALLWALGQWLFASRLWLQLGYWSASGSLGGWLAGYWRRTGAKEAALAAHLQGLVEAFGQGSEREEGFWRACQEAQTVCRELAGRDTGRWQLQLQQLAEIFPYAGIVYAKARRGDDPALARKILQRHQASIYPRARWAARRLLRRLPEPGQQP